MPAAGREFGVQRCTITALSSRKAYGLLLDRRRCGGFTLIELMVTIFVFSILMALAVPSYRNIALNNRRAAAANEFVASLNYARALAISERLPVTMCQVANASAASPVCGGGTGYESGWIVFLDGRPASPGDGILQANDAVVDRNGDGTVDRTDAILRRHEPLPAGTTLHGSTPTVPITFNISGILPIGAGTRQLAVCDSRGWGNDSKVVVLAIGGRAQTIDKTNSQVTITSCSPP